MPKWIMIFYTEIKAVYTFYVFFLSIGIGLFCLFVDYKGLMKKKLKREAKICKFIGWIYLVGSMGFYMIFNILG